MKIEVDRDLCTGCGTCVALCPASFKLDDENKSVVIGESDCAKKGESACPEGAITITE
ncbi:ferredoxin [Patescibacteria group bacterium]|nr:ferredoxin [Patescibacteria group bacterium]MBU1673368.1 ferredoxin [Patescibacteria group bacterium]MBU1963412.1 ferredoxin [Patescibacteria group bacterium]